MKQNTKKNKCRIIALLVAVLALVPVLVLGISAYPGQSYIPYNGSYDLPDMSAAEQFQHIAEHNLQGQSVGDQWEYTFIPITLNLSDDVDWTYISYQLSIADENNNEFGHYTIGVYQDLDNASGKFVYRIGWDYTIKGVHYAEFPYVEGSNVALSHLLGYRVNKLSDGRSIVDMELVRYDSSNNEIVQTGYVSAEIPQEASKVFLQIKTNYASTKGYTIDNTVAAPHTPVDLLYIGDAYGDGYHDAAYDSVNSFDNMGRIIWTIVDMPFVLITQVLNFDVFGVNMGDIVLGLLTIGLCVFVLHKVGII